MARCLFERNMSKNEGSCLGKVDFLSAQHEFGFYLANTFYQYNVHKYLTKNAYFVSYIIANIETALP
jgi:hypothetical protein